LLQWRATHSGFNCYIEGYSEIVHLLMQVSEVIVTRGGTTTCAKALHFQCPIVFNAFGGIMPQEQLTWKFFRNGAGCHKVENREDFAALVDRWVTEPAAYQLDREHFLKLRYVEDPTIIIDELVGLANEVAGAKVRRRAFPPSTNNGNGATAFGKID
jgi:processive 1,2-diacylglycerol beta-glucosyltransferase